MDDATFFVVSRAHSTICSRSWLCVSLKHGLVIVFDDVTNQLHVYLLDDGSLVRTIGSKGRGKGQFCFRWGGLCTCPDGDSVLVAEHYNARVQEVRILETDDTSRCIRFVQDFVLNSPEYVDCNNEVIVVSQSNHCIDVFSWLTGRFCDSLELLATIRVA